jgi:hypothetical protein
MATPSNTRWGARGEALSRFILARKRKGTSARRFAQAPHGEFAYDKRIH